MVQNLTYDDVLIWPNAVSSIRSRFNDEECNPFYDLKGRLPVVSAPMDTIPSKEFIEKAESRLYAIFSHRFQDFEDQIEQVKLGAQGVIGLRDSNENVQALVDAGARHILLDVANGGNEAVLEKLESLQWLRPDVKLWAGNVAHSVTYKSIATLCDFVRCGIGGGSVCTTRVNTGVGVGNITAIQMCARAYEELSGPWSNMWTPEDFQRETTGNDFEWQRLGLNYPPAQIVADGGIRNNGDICKALAAGAHLVMIGRQFAGTCESAAPYPPVDVTRPYLGHHLDRKVYRGMASREVNEEHGKGDTSRVSVEGASGTIPLTGPVVALIDQMEANLRSSMSYVNASNLDDFRVRASLTTISPAVMIENRAHGLSK